MRMHSGWKTGLARWVVQGMCVWGLLLAVAACGRGAVPSPHAANVKLSRRALGITAPAAYAGPLMAVEFGKRTPETHQGRTECLTCHEFGKVGPAIPQSHKEAKLENASCLWCHVGPGRNWGD